MMHTRNKQRGGRRATHVLPATLGAALLLPSLAFAAVNVPPQPAAAADEAGPTWPGPWSRAEIQRLIVAEAVGNGTVPAPLALAVADVESDFVQRTVGNSGTVGVMQLHPDVAKSEFGADADALRDPVTNIRLGLRRLARLHERYDGDWELALSHFRGGELAKKDGRYRAHEFTRAYIRRVISCWRLYRRDPLVRAWIRDPRRAPPVRAGSEREPERHGGHGAGECGGRGCVPGATGAAVGALGGSGRIGGRGRGEEGRGDGRGSGGRAGAGAGTDARAEGAGAERAGVVGVRDWPGGRGVGPSLAGGDTGVSGGEGTGVDGALDGGGVGGVAGAGEAPSGEGAGGREQAQGSGGGAPAPSRGGAQGGGAGVAGAGTTIPRLRWDVVPGGGSGSVGVVHDGLAGVGGRTGGR